MKLKVSILPILIIVGLATFFIATDNKDNNLGAGPRVFVEQQGGTGISTYVTGDILYSDAANSLDSLPVGSTGQVLKVSGGVPAWGTDNDSGGAGASNWNELFTNALTPTNTVAGIFINASSTFNDSLRVNGNTTLGAATTTNLAVTGLGGGGGDLKVAADGSLYEGTDATGGGGGGAAWELLFTNAITPTSSTAGLFVNASSTFDGQLRVNGSLILANALSELYGGTGTTTPSGFMFGNAGTIQSKYPAGQQTVCSSAECKYVTDGTNDEVQIQAALDAHGRADLVDQTYSIGAAIVLSSNDSIFGQGVSTVLSLANTVNDSVLKTTGTANVFFVNLSNFRIEGNKANQTAGSCIYAGYAHTWNINNLHLKECDTYGIHFEGDASNFALNNRVEKNRIEDTGSTGLFVGNFAPNNHAYFNIIGGTDSNYCAELANTETNFIGNHLHSCFSHGLLLSGAGDNNHISDNYIENASGAGGDGINIVAASTGNRIVNNTIFNNNLDGISIAGDFNVIKNNKIFDRQASPTQDYGISLDAGADENIIEGNILHNNLTGEVLDNGTLTSLLNNGTTTASSLQAGLTVNAAATTTSLVLGTNNHPNINLVAGDFWGTRATTTNLAVTGLTSCGALETDSGGNVICGTDATGASTGAAWELLFTGAITPTTTNAGIFVTASSTFNSTLRVNGAATTSAYLVVGTTNPVSNLGAGSIAIGSGSVNVPTYTFAGDTNTGFNNTSDGRVNLVTNGATFHVFNSSSYSNSNQILVSGDTTPNFSFTGDTNTGFGGFSGGGGIIGTVDDVNSILFNSASTTITTTLRISNNATTTGSLALTNYTSCTALETDANGLVVCGVDDTGGGGAGAAWQQLFTNAITPTSSTAGIFVRASSTFDSDLRINGNATTTNHLTADSTLYVKDGVVGIGTQGTISSKLLTISDIAAPSVSAGAGGLAVVIDAGGGIYIKDEGGVEGKYEAFGTSLGVGTVSNHAMTLHANNTEWAVLTAAGLLGVNDTSPDAVLEISTSGLTTNDAFYVSSNDDQDGDYFKIQDSGHVSLWSTTAQDTFGFTIATSTYVSHNLTVAGGATTTNLTISGITGSTQCLQADTNGLVSGTGSACGAGGGTGAAWESIFTNVITPTNTSASIFVKGASSTIEVLRAPTINSTTTKVDTLTVNTTAVPDANDGATLGSGTTSWSDLFLASGGVVNFNNSDVTITHAANALAFAGVTGDYTFDDTVKPASDDGGALGTGVAAWSDLFLATGSVMNLGNGDITLVHSAGTFSFIGASSGWQFDDGPVRPVTDNLVSLGISGVGFSDLFLGSGAVINFNAGDVTLTHAANLLTLAGGGLDLGGADSLEIPNAAAPTTNAVGEIALDTTSNNFVISTTTTGGHFVAASATTTLYSFVVASTSPDFISGGIIDLPAHFLPQVITDVMCHVDAGTSQQIFLSDGTNDTNTITCSTTRNQYDITSNNTFTAYEAIRLEFATKSGTPDYIIVRVLGYRTSD